MTESNYKRGTAYYYVHRATLACALIGPSILLSKHFPLWVERPEKNGDEYHRVELTVVRTKAEARAADARLAKARKLHAKHAKRAQHAPVPQA